jgi:hypothetical protein
VKTYQYDSLTIPDFFKKLVKNHIEDYAIIDTLTFSKLCSMHNINPLDDSNVNKFYTIKILHELFTSETASNCSRGKILNIPYQWHWIEPNPRYDIHFVSNNVLLKNTKPPAEFYKYNSYADIDRTPYLYLSDLVSKDLKYYSDSCGTFSTFGWCSEREMAFVALTKILGYQGKVVAEGNHSWSEFIIPLKLNNGEFKNFVVFVDNTFNTIYWDTIEQHKIPEWNGYFGDTKLAAWYNRKAKSNTELNRIKNHLVPNKAMQRIENKLVIYLNNRMNVNHKQQI